MIKLILKYLITHRSELLKFIFIGFTTLGINLTCFHVFYGLIQLNYKTAVSISYVITVIAYFFLHRLVTFHVKNQKLTHNTWKFLAMLILNYVITLLITWAMVHLVKISPYFGILASTGVTAGISFFLMKYFVFKNKKEAI